MYTDAGHSAVDDDVWIERCASERWVALTKDTAILRHHKPALRGQGLRVFAFDSARLTGTEMASRFTNLASQIVVRSEDKGPFVDVLHSSTIERRWPAN